MKSQPTVAYLILAHSDVRQLETLIGSLSTERARFFVHVDEKSAIEPFAALALDGKVLFCEHRMNCAWGDFSLVEATLALVRDALAHPSRPTRLVLLSGACLPVQPTEYLESFFDQHPTDEFIEWFKFPDTRYGKLLSRVEHYWLRRDHSALALKLKAGRIGGLLQRIINRRLPTRNYRRGLVGLSPYVGSQWWALTREAAEYIVSVPVQASHFCEFVKNTDCPDEFFFQTVLGNSRFRGHLRHSLTYTSWLPGTTGPEPISSKHLEALSRPVVRGASNCNGPTPPAEVLFARKFSSGAPDIVMAVLRANQHKSSGLARRSAAGLVRTA